MRGLKMKIVAIKDMSAENDSVGGMWQETKIFDWDVSLLEVMQWVGTIKKKVILTIPENYHDEFIKKIS